MSHERSAAESVILDQREGIHTFLIEGSRDVILCIVILEGAYSNAKPFYTFSPGLRAGGPIGAMAFMDSIAFGSRMTAYFYMPLLHIKHFRGENVPCLSRHNVHHDSTLFTLVLSMFYQPFHRHYYAMYLPDL